MHPVDRALASVVKVQGWEPGNAGENRVIRLLQSYGMRCGERQLEVQQQHRVGRFRLDFAWPHLRIAMEADGWVHRSDDQYVRDRERDHYLRARGWLVFRVDVDSGDLLGEQVMRVVRFVRSESLVR